MHLANFFLLALLCTLTMGAPQQNRPEDEQPEEDKQVEKSTDKPVVQTKPAAESSKPVEAEDDPNSDVRREEHKKIVPFQFHRVCRELDLKRQNCSCVWESTYEDGLDSASEKTRACKKDTEEETSECLSKLTGYSECLANPSFEHHRPTGTHDDALSRKCQEFGLSDVLCTCLKDRDSNDALKNAIHACKDDAKKTEPEVKPTPTSIKVLEAQKNKRQTKEEPQELSEHSQSKATPSPQHQINKECVIAALNAHCETSK